MNSEDLFHMNSNVEYRKSNNIVWKEYCNKVIMETKVYWCIPKYTLFHELISTIISQQVSFFSGRETRKRLYTELQLKVGESMTPQKLRILTPEQLFRIRIPDNKMIIIGDIINNITDDFWGLAMCNIGHLNRLFSILENIKGIGPWTINSLKMKLFTNIYPNILLFSDKWIVDRYNRLRPDLQKCISSLTNTDCYIVPNGVCTSEISLFLWRVHTHGIDKFNNGLPLGKDDFV